MIIKKSRAIIGPLRDLASSAQQVEARLLADDENISQQAAELHQAEADEALAQARLADLDAAIAELDRKLLELEPAGGFTSSLNGRPAMRMQPARQVVSLVQRDFTELGKLMDEWRNRPRSTEGDQPTRIDRIVLYIDDLDRCDPEQVVNVLQAVHAAGHAALRRCGRCRSALAAACTCNPL